MMEIIKGKKLFTPGPLGCSDKVKKAMLRDVGSRDIEFATVVKNIRQNLLEIAEVSSENYTAIVLQGSGTYAVESVFQTNRQDNKSKVLILSNGAYGRKMKIICDIAKISANIVEFPENSVIPVSGIRDLLAKYPYSLVAMVHCETSNGTINPVEEIGSIVKSVHPNAVFFVDAMSSFGAVPIDICRGKIDYLVTSANKCLQGVPGFSIVIARKRALLECKGRARTFSLDLVDQFENLENSGLFRSTPATHTFLAFQVALKEFLEEGGISERSKRYKQNCSIIQDGMRKLGFKTLLPPSLSGYIITSFVYPKHPNFNFEEFYCRLSDLGQLIYPGKVTIADCFRIGNIGNLFPSDMEHLLKCIEKVLSDMKVPIPVE